RTRAPGDPRATTRQHRVRLLPRRAHDVRTRTVPGTARTGSRGIRALRLEPVSDTAGTRHTPGPRDRRGLQPSSDVPARDSPLPSRMSCSLTTNEPGAPRAASGAARVRTTNAPPPITSTLPG